MPTASQRSTFLSFQRSRSGSSIVLSSYGMGDEFGCRLTRRKTRLRSGSRARSPRLSHGTRRRDTSFGIGTLRMGQSSCSVCAPWVFETGRLHSDHPGEIGHAPLLRGAYDAVSGHGTQPVMRMEPAFYRNIHQSKSDSSLCGAHRSPKSRQASARRFWKSFRKPDELLGRSVERVHLKLDVRWTALKRPFQELLRNRISEAKYRAPEKAAL